VSADIKAQIGRRLRRVRKVRGLTQKELASKIVGKVDYTYVGKIERGQQLPSLKVLGRLSEALAVPLAYFFQDEAVPDLLPDELRRVRREEDRAALFREVARIARADIPLLSEIIRVLGAHRRLKRDRRKVTVYPFEAKKAPQRAADWPGRYRRRRPKG
jgi:transcriptional regulator with XRE-family HTH domain